MAPKTLFSLLRPLYYPDMGSVRGRLLVMEWAPQFRALARNLRPLVCQKSELESLSRLRSVT